jgi:hypothetical protein
MSNEQSRGLELSSTPEIRRVWHCGEWFYTNLRSVVPILNDPLPRLPFKMIPLNASWFYSVVGVIAFLTGTNFTRL